MATQVNYNNLFTGSRNNVLALINTTNVPDPISSSSEYRKMIYSREPDVKAGDFKGYPFIIVHPADVDIEKEGGTLDGKSKNVFWNIEVEIVTSDRGAGNNDGKGLTHIDSISDSLVSTFNSMTNRNTLSANSMLFSRPETTSVQTEVIANELVYRRSILLSFKNRIQVSA